MMTDSPNAQRAADEPVRLGLGCCGGYHSHSVELDEEIHGGDRHMAVIVVRGYRINLTYAAATKLHRLLSEWLGAQDDPLDSDDLAGS